MHRSRELRTGHRPIYDIRWFLPCETHTRCCCFPTFTVNDVVVQLRVAKVTGGAASKLSKIKVVRKNIARVLTVLNTKAKTEMRKQVLKKKAGGDLTKTGSSMKYKPKLLRAKKTRALRRALKPSEVRGCCIGRRCFRFCRMRRAGTSSHASILYPHLNHCPLSHRGFAEGRKDRATAEEGAEFPHEEIRSEGINTDSV